MSRTYGMAQYRKKPVVIEATQWWKNGDHPDDLVGKRVVDQMLLAQLRPWLLEGSGEIAESDIPEEAYYTRLEGAVVRFFRLPPPGPRGVDIHDECGFTWHDHGWIDTLEGGHTVCPGDWIITGVVGEHYPCKNAVFVLTYEAP